MEDRTQDPGTSAARDADTEHPSPFPTPSAPALAANTHTEAASFNTLQYLFKQMLGEQSKSTCGTFSPLPNTKKIYIFLLPNEALKKNVKRPSKYKIKAEKPTREMRERKRQRERGRETRDIHPPSINSHMTLRLVALTRGSEVAALVASHLYSALLSDSLTVMSRSAMAFPAS